MAERAADNILNGFADNRPSEFKFGTAGRDGEQQIRDSFNDAILAYDEKILNKLDAYDPTISTRPNFKNSWEHAVLLSLTWNGGTGIIGTGLLSALSTGNRAEAWFQIRYNSNGGQSRIDFGPGIAARRYIESNQFGLFDDSAALTDDEKIAESKNVVRTLDRHAAKIAAEESEFPPATNGDLVAYQIRPAVDMLIEKFGLGQSFDGKVLVGYDPFSAGTTTAGQDDIPGSARNDLIFGEGGNDIIDGKEGDDVIYGGTGDDTLKGDAGNDAYVYQSGDGRDIIDDSDGKGSLVIAVDPSAASGAALSGSDKTAYRLNYIDTWDGAGGLHYTLLDGNLKDGGTLRVSGGAMGDGQIDIQHFKNGDLGITLNSEYDLAWLNDGEATPFTYGGAEPQPSSGGIGERGSRQFRVVLNRAARAGDKIVLKASGGQASHLAVTFGDRTESFAGGTLELTLAEGQSEVAFAVAEVDDLNSPETYTLSATLQPLDADTAGVSADYTLTVDGIDDTPAPITPTHTIDGGPGAETGKDPKPVSDSDASDQINCGPGNNTVTIVSGGDTYVYNLTPAGTPKRHARRHGKHAFSPCLKNQSQFQKSESRAQQRSYR